MKKSFKGVAPGRRGKGRQWEKHKDGRRRRMGTVSKVDWTKESQTWEAAIDKESRKY